MNYNRPVVSIWLREAANAPEASRTPGVLVPHAQVLSRRLPTDRISAANPETASVTARPVSCASCASSTVPLLPGAT